MSLTRDAILSRKNDLPRERVEIAEWGGCVWVRTLSAAERDQFEMDNTRIVGRGKKRKLEANLSNYRARLAVLACCDESGKRLFADTDAIDLGQQSAAILDRIVNVAHRLNGMRDDAEGAEKNSGDNPDDSSDSG